MTDMQVHLTVLIAAGVTILLRAAPFLLFPSGKQAPAYISLTTAPYGAPALIAVAVTAALHVWKRQMILSIAGGTAVYMILIRLLGM